jgi:hypothetical protein
MSLVGMVVSFSPSPWERRGQSSVCNLSPYVKEILFIADLSPFLNDRSGGVNFHPLITSPVKLFITPILQIECSPSATINTPVNLVVRNYASLELFCATIDSSQSDHSIARKAKVVSLGQFIPEQTGDRTVVDCSLHSNGKEVLMVNGSGALYQGIVTEGKIERYV